MDGDIAEMVVTKSFCDLKMFLPFLVNYGRGSLKAALCSIATLVQLGIWAATMMGKQCKKIQCIPKLPSRSILG